MVYIILWSCGAVFFSFVLKSSTLSAPALGERASSPFLTRRVIHVKPSPPCARYQISLYRKDAWKAAGKKARMRRRRRRERHIRMRGAGGVGGVATIIDGESLENAILSSFGDGRLNVVDNEEEIGLFEGDDNDCLQEGEDEGASATEGSGVLGGSKVEGNSTSDLQDEQKSVSPVNGGRRGKIKVGDVFVLKDDALQDSGDDNEVSAGAPCLSDVANLEDLAEVVRRGHKGDVNTELNATPRKILPPPPQPAMGDDGLSVQCDYLLPNSAKKKKKKKEEEERKKTKATKKISAGGAGGGQEEDGEEFIQPDYDMDAVEYKLTQRKETLRKQSWKIRRAVRSRKKKSKNGGGNGEWKVEGNRPNFRMAEQPRTRT